MANLLSLSLSVSLYLSLSLSVSLCLPLSVSLCLSVSLSVSVCLCLCLSLSFSLSFSLSLFLSLCSCYLVFNPKEPLVGYGYCICIVPCFIVIIPFGFISSEYRLYFVHDIIEKRMILSIHIHSLFHMYFTFSHKKIIIFTY